MIGQLSFPNGENGQLIDRIVASSLSGGFHFPSEATASRYPKNHHGLKDRYTSTSNILHRSVLYVLHVCSEIFRTCVTLRSNAGVSCLIHQLPGFFSILTRWLSHSNCECSMVSMVWRSRKSSISIHILHILHILHFRVCFSYVSHMFPYFCPFQYLKNAFQPCGPAGPSPRACSSPRP